MKLAIPTEDGFTISRHYSPAGGFLISTIQLGEITGQEIRPILEDQAMMGENGDFYNLEDCDKVIVREIDQKQLEELCSYKKEVIVTEEAMITKALIKFLNSHAQLESNSCCCP